MLKKIFAFIISNTDIKISKLMLLSLSITIISLLKYFICGEFSFNTDNIIPNFILVHLAWLVNTGLILGLSEFLGIKGIDLNLYDFFKVKFKVGPNDSLNKLENKLWNSMDASDNLDKGKGIDKGNNIPLPIVKDINPGPGFDVPGGSVPLNDPICSCLGYNSHFLRQISNMSLHTAIEQRNANTAHFKGWSERIAYVKSHLAKVPEIPTNEQQLEAREAMLRDLAIYSSKKDQSEGKITLLNSRIAYIEKEISKNK